MDDVNVDDVSPEIGWYLAGFADGEAAWAAWVPGFTATTLGVAGYLRGESLDFTTTVRDDADARYRQQYG